MNGKMKASGTILLVDDEGTFRESTCRLLEREGFECHTAADATEGIRLLEGRAFDLLVADIRMPGNSELRLVQTARELDSNMPVILITGYPSIETAIHSVELSVVAYLTKPVQWKELLKCINTGIAHSRNQRILTSIRKRLQTCLDDLSSTQWKPIPRLGGENEATTLGTVRTLAACLSDLLGLHVGANGEQCTGSLCELIDCPLQPYHRQAILETISVLKQTKGTFKSKELAQLRTKLEYIFDMQK